MAITLLAIPEGDPLPNEAEKGGPAIGQILVAHMAEVELMLPGSYDVTPKLWTRHTHLHELTVLDNGEGLYRMYPRKADAGYVERVEEGFTPFLPGGRHTPINAGNPNVLIAGAHPEKRGVYIFALINYVEIPM